MNIKSGTKQLTTLIVLSLLISLLCAATSLPIEVKASPTEYKAGFFTLGDIVIFSYQDGLTIDIYDAAGNLLTTQSLNRGDHYFYSVAMGVYYAIGNQPYSVLIGDPVTSYVMGYFAANDFYKGVAEEFYTYTAQDQDVIVFAYESGITGVTAEEWNGVAWVPLSSFTLNGPGDHLRVPQPTWSSKWLHFTSNQSISVEHYSDRCFAVPDESGLWSGTHFYLFTGWYSDGDNLHVHSYQDGNTVTVRYIGGSTIWTGTLNDGEWANIDRSAIGENQYIEVVSTKTVTVTDETYWTSDYYGLLAVPDQTGTGVGTKFYTYARESPPAGVGSIWVFAYKNDTYVEITDMTLGDIVVWSGTLDENEYYQFTPTPGSGGHLFGIFSDKAVSAVEGSGGAGATFVPLYYAALISVYVVIKPGADWLRPPPIDITYRGILRVAICGTPDFDVKTIDYKTIDMYMEGIEEGVEPIHRMSYQDVTEPNGIGRDGYLDLVLYFDTQTVVNAFGLAGHVGEIIPLILRGRLLEEFHGTAIEGQDYAWIITTRRRR